MIRNRPWQLAGVLPLLIALPLSSCSDSTSPDVTEVAVVTGTYTLTSLRFDPQGTLPDQDILPVLGTDNVQLILTGNLAAQVVYRDPFTDLFVTVQGTFRPTAEGVRLEWPANSAYQEILLSRNMDFVFDAGTGTLAFDGNAPDGVNRARLQTLVPAFQEEQLLDPTPGRLRVTFTRN